MEMDMVCLTAGLSLAGKSHLHFYFAVFGTGKSLRCSKKLYVIQRLNVKLCFDTYRMLTVGERQCYSSNVRRYRSYEHFLLVTVIVPADDYEAKQIVQLLL